MKAVQVVMPMAGRGSRFANAGYKTPKPLITVDNQAMFLKALSSLNNIDAEKHYTIIIRKEHDKEYGLTELLKNALPVVNVVVTDEEPTGAAADALRSKPYLSEGDAVIVMDCDLWFQSESYAAMVQSSIEGASNIAAGLLTFEADNPRYSYARIDANNIVTETAEKRVISKHAITGAYFFATTEIFVNAAEKLLEEDLSESMPEYYLSHLYNIIIKNEGLVQATYVDKFASFGTPEELNAYNEMSVNG